MYPLVDHPFENERLKEELEAIANAQARAIAQGGVLVTEYDQHYLPQLEKIKGVRKLSYSRYSSGDSSLIYGWECEFGVIQSLPGAPYGVAVVIPHPGVDLPDVLRDAKTWNVGEAVLDYSTRTVAIRDGETVITFPSVNVGEVEWKLLQEINVALIAQNAGVLVWKLSGVASNPEIQHIYSDGKVPMIRNEHAQGTVTGYARTNEMYNSVLVYAGVVAHKTALESLHATLLQKKSLSLDGSPVVSDSHFRMEAVQMPDFSMYHAALICDAAIPGKWLPQDESAYALVFKQPGQEENAESLLEAAVLNRLREVLPHAVKDEWAHELFTRAKQNGFIERLWTSGDCFAGARIHLEKDWTAVLGDMLAQAILVV